MKVLIFQTNIDSKKHIESFKPIFNGHKHILDWSIDIEDIDNVLRIEATDHLHEADVMHLVSQFGFDCDDLLG